MQEFLLILKGDGMSTLSPDEMQQLLLKYKAWVQKLGDQYVAGQRLQNKGSFMKNKDNVMTDGPFLEPKEMIAGYFVIRAKDQNEADTIALSSPHLGLYQIEVRPLVQPLMH
ncbi:MAG TPA: YciI family protein [Cyclobacteriaceae bacterium]|jgi:hypothetical protein